MGPIRRAGIKHTHVGTGCETNGTVAGGTAHMSPLNGGGALVEIGWRDLTDGTGHHYYRLFTESCVTSSACNVQLYTSGCASDGTTVTMKVRSSPPGDNVWDYGYSCNGGAMIDLPDSGGEPFAYANPRVETFRMGPPGDNDFIKDDHTNLHHFDKVGTVHNDMGLMVCDLGVAGIYGDPNANPATSWTTRTSGTTC